MFGIGWNTGVTTNESAAARDLRTYVRWEYRERDADWLLAAAHGAVFPVRVHGRPSLGERFRRWLNSFRGYAVFDVRGVDDPTRT